MYNPTYYTRQRWHFPKEQERNFLAAFFHMTTIALTCTSLAQLGWFRLRGGQCTPHLAVYQFFSLSYYDTTTGSELSSQPITVQYYSSSETLTCVTPDIASLMRLLIILCFMAMISSLLGFFLDIVGPTKKICKLIRRNAIPSIFTVLLVVGIVGVCYYTTMQLEMVMHRSYPGTEVHVSYEYGCYTITAAGGVALLATACNLFQQQPSSQEDFQRRRLVEDWEGVESFVVEERTRATPLEQIPPPPPYTP